MNIFWDCQKFCHHPVAAENFVVRGRNTLISIYHYRVYPKLGKVVCVIFRIPCVCPACVDKLDKYWLPNCAPSSQPRYARDENCYFKKNLNITTIVSSWNSYTTRHPRYNCTTFMN